MSLLLAPLLLVLAGWLALRRSSANLANRLWLGSSLVMIIWLWLYAGLPRLAGPDARKLWFVFLLLGLEFIRTALPALGIPAAKWRPPLSAMQAFVLILAMAVVPLPTYAAAPLVLLAIILLPIGARLHAALQTGPLAARLAFAATFIAGFVAALFPFVDRNWLPVNSYAASLGSLVVLLACLTPHLKGSRAEDAELTGWRQVGLLVFLAGAVPHFLQFA